MVKIYLRSVKQDGKTRLALFDSTGNGDIGNLTTGVPLGDEVIWTLDRCSGIKSITKIYSKNKERTVFHSDPRKRFLCKGFKFKTSNSATGAKEHYTIEYILRDGSKEVLDPCIRIDPPKIKP